MSKITSIGSNIKFSDFGDNKANLAKPPNIFQSDIKYDPTKGTDIETGNETEVPPPEAEKALRFLHIFCNDDILNDDTMLAELEILKESDINLRIMLDNFRMKSGDFGGLLDHLEELSAEKIIKQSTVDKYKKYFTDELEKYFGFNRKYRSTNESYEFKHKKYNYKSDKYNVIQKDENILEVENLSTKEKRIIDFRKILSKEFNGIQDIISLKTTIQNLPAEILFQIPEEISIIMSKEAIQDITLTMDKETGELLSDVDDIEGKVTILDNGMETLTTNSNTDTIIHEIAHTIFFNDKGDDVLENNAQLVEIFNKGATKYRDTNNYSNEKDGYTEEGYWSEDISELGAEIISAVFTNNTTILDTIDEYAPGAIEIVLDEFKKRLAASDKHNKTDTNSYIDYITKLEEEEEETPESANQ